MLQPVVPMPAVTMTVPSASYPAVTHRSHPGYPVPLLHGRDPHSVANSTSFMIEDILGVARSERSAESERERSLVRDGDVPRDMTRDLSRDSDREPHRESHREPLREPLRDLHREPHRDVHRDHQRERESQRERENVIRESILLRDTRRLSSPISPIRARSPPVSVPHPLVPTTTLSPGLSAAPARPTPVHPAALHPSAALTAPGLPLYKHSSVYDPAAAVLTSPYLASPHMTTYPGPLAHSGLYSYPYGRPDLTLFDRHGKFLFMCPYKYMFNSLHLNFMYS